MNILENSKVTFFRIFTPFVILMTAACFFPSLAKAQDNCASLAENPEWGNGLKTLSTLIQEQNYQEAKHVAKDLQKICSRSPLLNYMQGRIAENLQDYDDAKYRFQKASEYTSIFTVSPETANKIWYARYESEHRDQILAEEQTKKDLEAAQKQLEDMKMNSGSLSDDFVRYNETIMWTGVGIGVAGLIFVGTGAGLAASVSKDYLDVNNGKLSLNEKYTIGWGLLGGGIGLTVVGAVMAGIGGYHYNKSKKEDVISLSVSPIGASFKMTF